MRVQTECGVQIGLVTQIAEQQIFDDKIVQLLMELGVPFKPSKQIGAFSLPGQVVRSALALRRFAKTNPSRNIYVRGVWGAYSYLLAYPLGGPQLIYDFRGDVETEFSYRKRRRLKTWMLSRLVGRAIRAADVTICTSKPGARLLELRYGAKPSTVIPSCVDTRRYATSPRAIRAARSKLGYANDDIVFVYSGGVSRYQMIQEMIDIWATFQDDPKIKFLLLTNQAPTPIASHFDISAITPARLRCTTVSRDQIPSFLSASDVGFMLREEHPVNRVASPVKLGEYLACGLPVVTSPGIGDASDIVASRRLGALVSPSETRASSMTIRKLVTQLKQSREDWRFRAKKAALELFDWRVHIPAWKQLLEMCDPHD